jgi:hypothetical protein
MRKIEQDSLRWQDGQDEGKQKKIVFLLSYASCPSGSIFAVYRELKVAHRVKLGFLGNSS